MSLIYAEHSCWKRVKQDEATERFLAFINIFVLI